MAVKRRQVRVLVLCEDSRHRQFMTAYLLAKGYDRGKLDIRTALPGHGSAERYVRENYAAELSGFRRYCIVNESGTCAFLAMIDADTRSVQARLSDFDSALVMAGQLPRADDECVCILVPKRNVETWVYYLLDNSRPVDERRDYKTQVNGKAQLVQAGRSLVAFTPGGTCPPSLARGHHELEKLPPQ